MTQIISTSTARILALGIDTDQVQATGLATMRHILTELALAEAGDEDAQWVLDQDLADIANITRDAQWDAGWEWMRLTRAMLRAAAQAVACDQDARLVIEALGDWYEPMGDQDWARLAQELEWTTFTTGIRQVVAARRAAGYPAPGGTPANAG